jgi:hypothetical protein
MESTPFHVIQQKNSSMENYRDTRKTMPAYTKRLFISWQQDAHTH